MSDPLCCLNLIIPPAVEETVLDQLLLSLGSSTFTRLEAHGHGLDPAHLNISEQVQGRARQVQIQIILSEADAGKVLAELKQSLPQVPIFHWLMPVLSAGEI